MFSFANPYLLYLLLLLPVVVLLYWLASRNRRHRLRMFGRIPVLTPLMPEVSRYTHGVKLLLQLLAIAALVFLLARPRAGAKEEVAEVNGIEVMICLDVSNSMLASASDDPRGVSRLQRAKLLLEKLISRLRNDKVGLIVFAGDAYTQLPLTADFSAAKMFLNSISTEMVPTQGTAIGAAVEMAMTSFSQNEDMQKAIIVITDGENFEDDAVEATKLAAENGIQVDVIGLGSTKGALIPTGRDGQFMRDETGNPVTTRLNEEMAREIAAAGNGIYVQGSSSSALSDLDNQLEQLAKGQIQKITYAASAEQFPVFAWLALLFIIADILVPERKIGWLKRYTFFSDKTSQHKNGKQQ
ncbi:MAG: VWA domain-containing protein [Muribaculum sp.]|nr:VWA domain-containing protein [Muribaculum sp.]